MKAIKPIYKLNADDLREWPIWQFTDDDGAAGQDETWVLPVRASRIPRERFSLIVAARFVSQDDRMFMGFMTVTTVDKKMDITPGALVTPSYLSLPLVSAREARRKRFATPQKERAAILKRLGASDDELFPLQYILRVAAVGVGSPVGGFVE